MKPLITLLKSPWLTACFIAGVLFTLFTLFPMRLDFSKGNAYTLSPSTRTVLHQIAKPVTITMYMSSELPTRILPLKNDVVQLLQEYRRSGSSIRIVEKDPKGDSKAAEKAKELGIPQLQYSQLEQNKYQTSAFYFGLALEYNGKTETIPQVSDYANLEYNLTSALYRLTKKEMPKIAFIHEPVPAYGQQQGISVNMLRQLLSQQYTVSSFTFSGDDKQKDKLSDFNTVLVFDDGSSRMSSEEINSLKTYFESGHNVVVLANGVWIDEQSLQVVPAEHNLNELTATYGAQINSDLALSLSAEYVNFGNSVTQFLAPYPFWIRTNLFNKQSGLFANIQYVSFPWVSTISPTIGKNTKIIPIISTSDRSWLQKDNFVMDPNSIPQPKLSDLKTMMIGTEIKHTKGGTMVVIPSSRFVTDAYIGKGTGNLDLILNAVDSVSSHGVMTGIRSRAVSFYPLPDLSDSFKNVYKYSALLIGPLLWIGYGAIRLLRRQKKTEKSD